MLSIGLSEVTIAKRRLLSLAFVSAGTWQASDRLLKGTVEANKKAVEYFNQAIAIDEKYAVAYAELAQGYALMVNGGWLDPKEGTPKAEAAAKKALELDEGCSPFSDLRELMEFSAIRAVQIFHIRYSVSLRHMNASGS